MYNLELVFVTPVKVKIIDKSFEKMLGEISGCGNYALPYVAREITNTLTIENAAKIPSKSAIAEIKRSGLIIDDKKVLNALSHSSQSRYLMSSPRKRSTVSEEEFNKLFNQVNEVLVSIGNEILSGNANAVPKEGGDACKYCSYASICRAAEKNDK